VHMQQSPSLEASSVLLYIQIYYLIVPINGDIILKDHNFFLVYLEF
jgi:hypothetical protein